MRLIDVYEAAISTGDIQNDPAQREVLTHLQRLTEAFSGSRSLFNAWGRSKIPGFYLYGPVGAGKTYLVDLFYATVAEPRKARLHFHHFMREVDAQLRRLQGQRDPLKRVVAMIANTTRLLCLDEFLVEDVAVALILATLLKGLIEKGVVLVISSNTAPDELYLNGVQRDRFLPAIALLKQHCDVVAMEGSRDYRLGRSPSEEAYLYPLDNNTQQRLAKLFNVSAAKEMINRGELSVQNRPVRAVQWSKRVIWFQFNIICNVPRSALDYLEIAQRFDTVFVSDIPLLTSEHTTQVVLLMRFIDVMYDQGVKLVVSAEVPPTALYPSGGMYVPFQRTLSRLEEMQSEDYLRRHRRRYLHTF